MRGRPGKRRASKGAKKSTRSKASKSKASRSKASKSKSTRSKRTTTRKSKAPARKKTARKSTAVGRKTATRKATKKTSTRKAARRSPGAPRKEVFGEGNYTASREFRRGQTDFVRRNRKRIPEMGEAAESALESGEGRELEEAEDRARSHSHSPDENL